MVHEQLTGLVDTEAVWYCVISESGTEGRTACPRGEGDMTKIPTENQSGMRRHHKWHAPVMQSLVGKGAYRNQVYSDK